MAGLISSSSHQILRRHLLRPSPPPSSSPSLASSFHFQPPIAISRQSPPARRPRITTSSSSVHLSSGPRFFSSSSLPLLSHQAPLYATTHSLSTSQLTIEPKIKDKHDVDDEFETEIQNFESEGGETVGHLAERVLNSPPSTRGKESTTKPPSLTVKEKKDLASYAHSLGKKLKSQQVGKSGVTESVAMALVETLEANELLKLKIHNTCPGEFSDVVKQLEGATGSMVVGQIGRTVILYRPSLTKLKAEEKKKQAQRVFARKRLALKPSFENKGQRPRLSKHGHRGSSRFS